MKKFWMTLALMMFAAPAAAQEVLEETSFTAAHWTNGLHMSAGLGMNLGYFDTDLIRENLGPGLNIQTDVGYYFGNIVALEVAGNVMLTRVSSTMIWDTMMTFGVRARLPDWAGPEKSAPFFRLLGGRGPSVFIFKGEKPAEYDIGEGERTQIEGDVFGAAYGLFQDGREGTTWYLQLQYLTHIYRKVEVIDDVNGVPEAIFSRRVSDSGAMHSLSLTFGVLLF
ncbi:MAG: hypothetical protein V4655_01160 [Bdellovibrionota bacterium]|nr:MAG: hypothetical protein EOP10_12395 [Pseudomonadota bacterium]